MATVIEYPDLELWAAGYLRAGLTAWSATADRRWPTTAGFAATGYDVIVRDDSGPDQQFHADRLLGVTVLGPEGSHQATGRCAERAAALLRASPENLAAPVVRCTAIRGPYAIESDTGRPTFYLTADLRIVGTPVTL